jgi:regulatory protein
MRRKTSDLPAYQQAMGLLVRREHSRRELKQKLRQRGKEADEIDTALESLSRQDFQNDARFAMALARSRQAAGYGPVRIRAELAQHNLGTEVIAETMACLSEDWLETAQGLVARRYLRKIQADPAQSRKAVDFLLRRGFDQKTAFTAVKIREWPSASDLIDESP